MKTVGIVSYNIHCDFMTDGSAVERWTLERTIDRLDPFNASAHMEAQLPSD